MELRNAGRNAGAAQRAPACWETLSASGGVGFVAKDVGSEAGQWVMRGSVLALTWLGQPWWSTHQVGTTGAQWTELLLI